MGPLNGFKILEFATVGPVQQAGMLLAEMGADVVRIDRPGDVDLGFNLGREKDLLNRSRPTVGLDLKSPGGAELALELCRDADAIIEGFRPGVMERLGLGPDVCLERNPALVYGRVTGYGQEGPLADAAGHDPNFIALAGLYGCIGERGGDPVYPMNLAGDMAGGAAYLVMGVLAALLEASRSKQGQVVDAAMVDGVASQMTCAWGLMAAGMWSQARGTNVLDGGAPYSRAYRTRDGHYVAIAPIESRFFANLLQELQIDDIDPETRTDPANWEPIQERLQAVFAERTRDEWCDLLEGTDTCFSPVLRLDEVADHPHIRARRTVVRVDGVDQPAPAPRFSRTVTSIRKSGGGARKGIGEVLEEWGAGEPALNLARGLESN